MKEFQLRNLQTGDIIARNGADRREILKRCAPGRALHDKDGNPVQHAGFCDLGREPPGWKVPKGKPSIAEGRRLAKMAPLPADEPDDEENELEE